MQPHVVEVVSDDELEAGHPLAEVPKEAGLEGMGLLRKAQQERTILAQELPEVGRKGWAVVACWQLEAEAPKHLELEYD